MYDFQLASVDTFRSFSRKINAIKFPPTFSFSASYAPKLSASTKMGLLDAFIDDVEPAWDWKAFLEASSTSELRALYRQDDSRLYHELVQTRGERAAVLALLPRHSLALEWECEHLQAALELLSCDEIERRYGQPDSSVELCGL